MASQSPERKTVAGRVDAKGRLIAADQELESLQRQAGAEIGQLLALPQIAAVAQLARKLGTSVGRPAIAASADSDIGLWVTATPEGEEVALSLEGWTVRPAAGPQLASVIGRTPDVSGVSADHEWATDEELRVISVSPELAELLGVTLEEAVGAPLTRIMRLEENEDGEMPLISALANRRDFQAQRARSRADEHRVLTLNGEAVSAANDRFSGFRGTARSEDGQRVNGVAPSLGFDLGLSELLRSPLDRIIDNAEQIVARADGPLRSDYASYGTDIATAARHLLSVLQSMSEDPALSQDVVDLAALAAEAVIMLEASAQERSISIELEHPQPLRAHGQERAVIQILVNLVVNAIRYSPEGANVRLTFSKAGSAASVTVADEGPGISAGDEQRIFERFERAHTKESGTGLGLAISRRLARSMGGDVTLDSTPGEGARFTLTLPAA